MAELNFDQRMMDAGAAKVDTATSDIQAHITTLRNEVEAMRAGWRGDAATSFTQLHQAFEDHANKINNALRQMHAALQSSSSTYSQQEQSQTSTFSGLAGQING